MRRLSQQRVLLTGGRAPATLDLARQLAAEGHLVYMAESCPAHLTLRSRAIVRSYLVPKPNEEKQAYIEALETIIRKERMDWLIPTCEEIYYVAQGLGRLREICSVFVDSFEKLKGLHDKSTFICRAKELGFTVPKTHLVTSVEEAKRIIQTSVGEKWVFKPVYSRFASKVLIVEGMTTPSMTAMTNVSSQHPWIAQQFVEGDAYCSYSVVKQGKVTAHVVYPVTFTAGLGACISFEAVQHSKIDEWVKRFAAAEQFTGHLAFDFIITPCGQVVPLECNPRLTSGIHLFHAQDRVDQAIMGDQTSGGKMIVSKTIVPQSNRLAMISLAMLSYGLWGIRSWRDFKRWLRIMLRGKDVVFRWNDILPFFQQFSLLWWNIKVSRTRRLSIKEASTYDIEWNGGDDT